MVVRVGGKSYEGVCGVVVRVGGKSYEGLRAWSVGLECGVVVRVQTRKKEERKSVGESEKG